MKTTITHDTHVPHKWFSVSIPEDVLDDIIQTSYGIDMKADERIQKCVQTALKMKGSKTDLSKVKKWTMHHEPENGRYVVEYLKLVKKDDYICQRDLIQIKFSKKSNAIALL